MAFAAFFLEEMGGGMGVFRAMSLVDPPPLPSHPPIPPSSHLTRDCNASCAATSATDEGEQGRSMRGAPRKCGIKALLHTDISWAGRAVLRRRGARGRQKDRIACSRIR